MLVYSATGEGNEHIGQGDSMSICKD